MGELLKASKKLILRASAALQPPGRDAALAQFDLHLVAGFVAPSSRVDVLVSWNFRHIVNLVRIHGYNSVNLRKGYPMIEIRTPREVLSDE